MGIQSFGVMAPPAIQWATFEKNRGPDAGAVMDSVSLYVKYHPRHILHSASN
jgi:hypothetical protein